MSAAAHFERQVDLYSEAICEAAADELRRRAADPFDCIGVAFRKWFERTYEVEARLLHGHARAEYIRVWLRDIQRDNARIWRAQVALSTTAIMEDWL